MSSEQSDPDQPINPETDPVDSSASMPSGDAQPGTPADDRRPSRKAAWLAMGAVALALGLIWIAPGVNDTRTLSGSAAQAGGQVVGEENPGDPEDADVTGKQAPLQFTLKDMNGVDVKLANFKGKVILLNFWATWCGPCRAEIPSLVELQQQYGKDLVVLGVSIDDPVDKLKPYASEMKMNYPVLVGDGRDDVQEAYGPLWGIPVSVFVDRDGKIAKKHSGIASKEQFEREIKALL
jgi:thiol-disulfide isomerase/thioredoxin